MKETFYQFFFSFKNGQGAGVHMVSKKIWACHLSQKLRALTKTTPPPYVLSSFFLFLGKKIYSTAQFHKWALSNFKMQQAAIPLLKWSCFWGRKRMESSTIHLFFILNWKIEGQKEYQSQFCKISQFFKTPKTQKCTFLNQEGT